MLVLIFLSAFVTISPGQFHQEWEKRHWRTPYFRSQHIMSNQHPVYYDYLHDVVPLFPQMRPISRVIQYVFNGQEFPDDQPRINGLTNHRPNVVIDQEPRFLFKNVASVYSNVFVKTVTFTSTSSVTLTSVETCIAAINILDAKKTTYCRRKRDILDNLTNGEEDFQFDIAPSELEQVMPTVLPSLDFVLDDYTFEDDATSIDSVQQVNPNEISFQDVTTSFNDPNQVSTSVNVPAILSWWNSLRGKLLFTPSLSSTTVTSFSFASTTVTKTVAIADEAQIKCLPLGWVVCY